MSSQPMPADENLPEVVPDSSPQALTSRDAYLAHEHLGEKDPKYVAETSPRPEERDLKFAAAEADGGADSPGLVKGEDGQWRPAPVSAITPTDTNAITPDTQGGEGAAEEGRAGDGGAKEAKVCGMKKRTFWIVLGVAIVVVLGAIGGGVGGGISARNNRSSPSSSSDEEEAPADEEEEDDTSDENFLNNGTAPKRGFAFQAFSEPLYGGEASDILTSEGFHDLGFEATSYVWVPNDTGCCISFCQTKNDTEFHWCDPRMRDEVEGESFPRLGVLCGDKMNPFADWFPCAEEDEEEEEEENEEEDGERGPREGGIARRRGE